MLVFVAGVKTSGGIGVDRIAIAAEQAIERRLGGLADDVPDGNVNAAHAHHQHATTSALVGPGCHLAPDPLDGKRILAEHDLAQLVEDDRFHTLKRTAVRSSLS